MKKLIVPLFLSVFAVAALDAAPTMSLRLRGPHTATEEQWNATFKAIKDNPGCCDEVWFSTGIGVPPLKWHREQAARLVKAAEDLRKIGIVPSLQFQATLGHSDLLSSSEDCSAKNWTGWTGSTGVEDKYCNCPRQSAFLDYLREMSRLYAAFKPGSVWVDDDLRIGNHTPATKNSRIGCWCDTCIEAFNKETGGTWTRKTLDAAMAKDAALATRWKDFSVQAIADIARLIAEEIHAISPNTMMAFQHAYDEHSVDSVRAITKAFAGATGKPTGLRPGGGMYYDINPSDQIVKSMIATRFKKTVKDLTCVEVWCPEVESWPRTYGGRSAQSVLVESFTAIGYGFNSTSMLILDTRYETDELYSRTLLKPLADAAPVLKGFARANEGTIPTGFAANDITLRQLYFFGLSGIPVLPGVGKNLGDLSAADLKLDICKVGSKTVQEARNALDARAGGTPAVLETPFVGLLMPHVTATGALRTVGLLNTRIDVQGPVTLRLRGVPAGAKIVWRELRRPALDLAVTREGDVARVTIPEIGAWNAGYLDIMF